MTIRINLNTIAFHLFSLMALFGIVCHMAGWGNVDDHEVIAYLLIVYTHVTGGYIVQRLKAKETKV